MGSPWMVKFRGESIPYAPRLLEQSKPGKNSLPPVWFGFDSEAAPTEDGNSEVQTYQLFDGKIERLEYVKTGDSFRHFWSLIIRAIPEELWRDRNSRLVMLPVYCHNWEYDWGMAVKTAPEGWKNQSKMNTFFKGFKDEVQVERTSYSITVENGHMLGNAPTLTVVIERKKKAVRVRLLDTFPFFPKALATVAKDLGMEKGDRASVIGVDWRPIGYKTPITAKNESGETVTVFKRDFERYGKHDAVVVWHLAKRIRLLHESEGLTSLAVSGAGYAAKVMLRHLDAPFQGTFGGISTVQLALDAFHGGRSGRLVHGRVSGMSVYDFRSSYPSVQRTLPVLHPDYSYVYKHKGLDVPTFMEMAKRYHGFARVSGVEHDVRFPSLLSANTKGSIRAIVGEFHSAPATAAEIYMGVVFGGIELTSIEEAVFIAPKEEHKGVSPFGSFIHRAWDRKNSFPKGAIEYDAAKIQANSGYGKMIEHRGSQQLVMDVIQIPLRVGGKEGEDEARNFFLNIHPDYWHEYLDEWRRFCGQQIAGYTFLSQLIKAVPEFGYYATPQYAAWITGHAHARLVLMMRLFDGVKWDTDSVTTALSEAEVKRRIESFPREKLPNYIQPLSVGKDLGELDLEGRNLSGVILGNKRYYLEGEVSKDGKWVPGIKEGHHGLPGIKKGDIKGVLLGLPEARGIGGEIEYEPKAKPIKTKGARTWAEVGTFVIGSRYHRKLKPKFEADPKQDWANAGAYKPFAGFNSKTPS